MPIRFFLPGPTWVREDVRRAMERELLGHRSAAFAEIYKTLSPRLKPIFRTGREVYTASSSATLVMQAALQSTTQRRSLHLTNGAFAERWLAIGRSLGLAADQLEFEWGQPVDPDAVSKAVRDNDYEAVTVVHNETSTGVESPVEEIARAVREESDALVLVDTVSSMGGARIETDAWDLDVVLTGTQKALALPPGLAFFAMSERTEERAEAKPDRGFYTDLLRYRDKHAGGATITTPAMSVVFAADRQLEVILEETMEARWQRHRNLRDRTHAWAEERGLAIAAAEGARSMTVTCLRLPKTGSGPSLVNALAGRGFTVGTGYGKWKPDCFRIGHMAEVRMNDLEALLTEIDEVLPTL